MQEFALIRFNPDDDAHIQAHDTLMHEAFNTPPERNAQLRAMTGTNGIYLLFKNIEAVATINAQICAQYINGKALPCWMVAGVAVRADHRGQGVGTLLWEKLFYEAKQNGIILINLYPANLPYYRSLGFGMSATRTLYKANLDLIYRPKNTETVQPIKLFESQPWTNTDGFLPIWTTLKKAYEKFAGGSSGMIQRNSYLWAKKLATDKNIQCIALIFGSLLMPKGYLVYQETASDTLLISDWAALDMVALASIRKFLHSLKDRWQYARWFGAPSDPLIFSMPDHGYPNIAYTVHEQTHLMTRIVNIQAALECCGYSKSSGSLIVHYEDQHMPEQSGYYRLKLKCGIPKVKRIKRPAIADLHIGPRGMALLLSHILPASDIQRLGVLEANDKALCKSEKFFEGRAPWCADQY